MPAGGGPPKSEAGGLNPIGAPAIERSDDHAEPAAAVPIDVDRAQIVNGRDRPPPVPTRRRL